MRFHPLTVLRHLQHLQHLRPHPHPRGADRHPRWHRLSDQLDLNAEQQQLLDALVGQWQGQGRSLRGSGMLNAMSGLIASENFDIAGARQLFDSRLDALIAAAADLFDSLDFEQQQALRFMLRVRRSRSC